MIFRKKTCSGGPEYLIVGLGNPGRQYETTRHNAGWLCMDLLSDKLKVKINKIKFKSTVGEADIGGHRCLLMKPQTFMNLSGEAVGEACKFYKIPPENVIVIFDDISLPCGSLRIRRKGSAGGHNGIKSIIQHLGSDNFPRIKLGVGDKPHADFDLADYVLSNFSKDEIPLMKQAMEKACSALDYLTDGKIDEAMSRFSH
ncbi:MAG: aminoacyl-tRNA hydrolase [Clostridia bacterium]|nr:aminoacyl-tRNA hydrolase [Clostridia bacterium]